MITGPDVIATLIGSESSYVPPTPPTPPDYTELYSGIPTVFKNTSCAYEHICMMDSTHAIAVFRDDGNSGYGTAVCLTLNETTIVAGTPVAFEGTGATNIRVCKIDSTHAIVVYSNGGNGYGKAVCLTLSGTSISAGSIAAFFNISTSHLTVIGMDATHAIVCAYGASDYLRAVCLTLSGTNITADSPVVVAQNGSYTSIAMLDATHAIVCYQDNNNSGYGTAVCLTLSGTTITTNTSMVFESANTNHHSVSRVDATHALVAYTDQGNNGFGTACYLTLAGTTITNGTAIVFESAMSTYISISCLDATRAIIAYRDGGNAGAGTACYLTIGSTSLSATVPTVFNGGDSLYTSVAAMDSTHAIVVYKNGANSDYGTSCCLYLGAINHTWDHPRTGVPNVFEGSVSVYREVNAKLTETSSVLAYQDSSTGAGKVRIQTIDGNTITNGAVYTFESNSMSNGLIAIARLTDTTAILKWCTATNNLYVAHLTISGTAITIATPVLVESSLSSLNMSGNIVRLTDTTAVVIYQGTSSDNNYAIARLLTISGTVITVQSKVTVVAEYAEHPAVIRLNDTTVLAAFSSASTVNGKIRILTVSGTTMTPQGTATAFGTSYSYFITMARISDNAAIVTFTDYGNSQAGTAFIATIAGNTVSIGAFTVYDSSNYYKSLTQLSDTQYLLAYCNSVDGVPKGMIITINGIMMNFSVPFILDPGPSTYFSIAALTSTKAIFAFADNGNNSYGTATIIYAGAATTAWTIPSAFAPAVAVTQSAYECPTIKLTSSKAMMVYRDYVGSQVNKVIVFDVSGVTATAGSPYTVEAGTGNTEPVIQRITDSTALICYRAASSNFKAVVATVSGTTVSFGTPLDLGAAGSNCDLKYLDTDKFLVSYFVTDRTYTRILTVTGTTVTAGTAVQIDSAGYGGKIGKLSTTKAVIAYTYNSVVGSKAVIVNVSGTTVTPGTPQTLFTTETNPSSIDCTSDSKFVITYQDMADTGNTNKIAVATITADVITLGQTANAPVTNTSGHQFIATGTDAGLFVHPGHNTIDYAGQVQKVTLSGSTITLGPPTMYEEGKTYYCNSICLLDDSTALVTYADVDNNGYLTCCVIKDSTAIGDYTAGPEAIFNSGNTQWTTVCKLDATRMLVAYQDVGNSNYGTACVLTLSGDRWVAGAETVFYSGKTTYLKAVLVSTNKVLVTYCASDGWGEARILTISGSTVTSGSQSTYHVGEVYYSNVTMIDTDKAIVVYGANHSPYYGRACVLTISGTSVGSGSEAVFEYADVYMLGVCKLDTNKALVTYMDIPNSYYGTACVLSVSGTTITPGSPTVFSTVSTGNTDCIQLGMDKAIVTYIDRTNNYKGMAQVLTVSGTTVTANTPYTYSYDYLDQNGVTAGLIDTNLIAVAYSESGKAVSRCRLISVTGTSMTMLPEVYYNSWTSLNQGIAAVDNTKFAVTYKDGRNTYGKVKLIYRGDQDGGSLYANNVSVVETNNCQYPQAVCVATDVVLTVHVNWSDYAIKAIGYSTNTSSFSASSSYSFDSTNEEPGICKLNNNRAIVVYHNGTNSNYGTARVLYTTGGTLSAGSSVVFESAYTVDPSVARINDSKAVVVYRDGGNAGYITGCVLNVSSNDVTPATPTVLYNVTGTVFSTCGLDGSRIACIYCDDSGNTLKAFAASVSGNTITAGTRIAISNTNLGGYRPRIATLDSGRALITWFDYNDSYYLLAAVLTITGTTVTMGPVYCVQSTYSSPPSVTVIDSAHAVIACRDESNSYYGKAYGLTIDGTEIRTGPSTTFDANAISNTSICVTRNTNYPIFVADRRQSSGYLAANMLLWAAD